MLGVSFLLSLMLFWTSRMPGRGRKQGGLRGMEPTPVVSILVELLQPSVTSQGAKLCGCFHTHFFLLESWAMKNSKRWAFLISWAFIDYWLWPDTAPPAGMLTGLQNCCCLPEEMWEPLDQVPPPPTSSSSFFSVKSHWKNVCNKREEEELRSVTLKPEDFVRANASRMTEPLSGCVFGLRVAGWQQPQAGCFSTSLKLGPQRSRNSAKVKGLTRNIKIKSSGAAEDLYSRRCFSSCSDPPASPTLSRWKPAASLQKQLRLRKRNDVKDRFHVSAPGGLGG